MVTERFPPIVVEPGYAEVPWHRLPRSEFLDEIEAGAATTDRPAPSAPTAWSMVLVAILFGVGVAFW